MRISNYLKPRQPRPKSPRAFPLRWWGYDREAVDIYLQQVASSHDRLHSRLLFLEELIGSWQEQGIELPQHTSDGRDFRYDPRAAYDQLQEDAQRRAVPVPTFEYPPAKRLTGRARPLLLGFDTSPEALAMARKRKIVLAIGLALMLAAMLFTRRISHTSALTSSASPHVVAEPMKRLPQTGPDLSGRAEHVRAAREAPTTATVA